MPKIEFYFVFGSRVLWLAAGMIGYIFQDFYRWGLALSMATVFTYFLSMFFLDLSQKQK